MPWAAILVVVGIAVAGLLLIDGRADGSGRLLLLGMWLGALLAIIVALVRRGLQPVADQAVPLRDADGGDERLLRLDERARRRARRRRDRPGRRPPDR